MLFYLTNSKFIKQPPYLKGIIISATQFESPNKYVMAFQNLVFCLLPSKIFKKFGLTKKQVLTITSSLKQLQLRDELNEMPLPTLIMCGSKDSPNLSASKELENLIPNASLTIISGGRHELNKDKPEEFANAINDFLKSNYFS